MLLEIINSIFIKRISIISAKSCNCINVRRILMLPENIYLKSLLIMSFLQDTAVVTYRFIVHGIDTVMLHPISRKLAAGHPLHLRRIRRNSDAAAS